MLDTTPDLDPARNPASDRARIAAITAAITCVAVVGIGLSLSIPLLSIEMARMGASSTLIGVNTAVSGLASILTVPFVPRLAARVGVVRLLLLAIGLGAACLVAFPLLPTIGWWFVLRFVFSAALGALFVLSEFWINEAAPPARRGLVMGVYATILALGFAVGPTLLALLGTQGFAPYLAGAALFLAGMLPMVLARGLSPAIGRGPSRRFATYLRVAPAATLAALTYGAVETGGFAILPLYGLRLGYDAESAAGLVSALALGNVLFQIPFGWLADRMDRRVVLLIAAAGGALGAALIPAASGSLPLLVGLLFAWGGIAGTLYTVGLAHLGSSVRGADLAGANAAFVVLYNVGLMLGPPIIGGGMDLMPPQGFAWTLSGLFLAYGAVVLWRLRAPARP
ncbi:MFS transporter [Methylobacterium soli]|uniref:MFS transporter n=1 Tax=Methylobacterium soli TaxID=553447 RepID=A0A6L3SXP7_9HYPH|nr:MFS transporter [Methylobacterium soli]KAB1077877.1 MFS transporter [Methylobacterium soli]GJE42106.1 putative MFS-type transporter YcaD [Methylobacterium soli]